MDARDGGAAGVDRRAVGQSICHTAHVRSMWSRIVRETRTALEECAVGFDPALNLSVLVARRDDAVGAPYSE